MTKYTYGDTVSFELEGKTITGTVAIVDANGTWENPGKPSYDILGEWEGKETLFKHIPETDLK